MGVRESRVEGTERKGRKKNCRDRGEKEIKEGGKTRGRRLSENMREERDEQRSREWQE